MTDEQILIEIQVRQKKLDELYKLYNKPISNVQIWYNTDDGIVSRGQNFFPFNLAYEIKILYLESINFYETEIQELKNKL